MKPILPPNLFVGNPIRSTDTLGINVLTGTPEEPFDETIAEVLPGTDLQRAQAEEIVRRCNTFPALLAALTDAEHALRWAAQEASGRVKAEIVGGWLHHANAARAAIAKAKEGA